MTKNPGFYTGPLDCDEHYTRALCGPTPPKVVYADIHVVVTMLVITAAIITVGIITVTLRGRERRRGGDDVVVVIGTCLIIAGAILGFITGVSAIPHHVLRHASFFGIDTSDPRGTDFSKYEEAHTMHGYEETVRTWLSDDYGIHVNLHGVNLLRHGQEVAVTYAGKPIGIQFMTAGNGGLAIRETGGTVIAPLDQ